MASRASSFQPPSPTAVLNAFYTSVLVRINSLNIDHEQKPYLVFTISKLQSLAEPMTSLVADFLVNPVIRQAQRIRSGSFNDPSSPDNSGNSTIHPGRPHDDSDPLSQSESDEALNLLRQIAEDSSSSFSLSARASLHLDRSDDAPEFRHGSVDYAQLSNSVSDATSIRTQPGTAMADESSRTQPGPSVTSGGFDDAALLAALPARKARPIPEDDGMSEMRRRIFSIQVQDISATEKARLMHHLFQEDYAKTRTHHLEAQPPSPSDAVTWQQPIAQGPLESLKFWQSTAGSSGDAEHFTLTEQDVRPTYAPRKTAPVEDNEGAKEGEQHLEGDDMEDFDPSFGCEHYMRNVKLQCSTCSRWYTCRFCHDEVEDHALIRKDTKNMLCMYCGTPQRAGDTCVACSAMSSSYYCGICKLWNNDPEKHIYHCDDCGICRIGRGLGKDFFHCKKCCACMAISKENDHICVERATDCDCPICGEYMFTSPRPVCILKCGHHLHKDCFNDHMKTSYKCPLCSKSVTNMDYQFRNLGLAIDAQPMPAEFSEARAVILCNDCSAKSQTKYHWLGLKCGVCLSYNTAQLQLLGMGAGNSRDTDIRPAGLPPARSGSGETSHTEVETAESSGARDIPRPSRRHSSSAMPIADLHHLHISERTARSYSPTQDRNRAWGASAYHPSHHIDEEEERQDMLGFWSRVPRSITSDNEEEESGESGAETESSSEEEDDDDEDDEEDGDDWEIFGHR